MERVYDGSQISDLARLVECVAIIPEDRECRAGLGKANDLWSGHWRCFVAAS